MGFPGSSVVKNLPAMQETQETWVWSLGGKDPLKRKWQLTPIFLGFPCDSAGKESACNAGDLGPIPGLGRSPGEGNSYPLEYSGLENSMDCMVHGVTKSQTWLIDFHFHFHFPIFLPKTSRGLRSLAGYSSWGSKKSWRQHTYTHMDQRKTHREN